MNQKLKDKEIMGYTGIQKLIFIARGKTYDLKDEFEAEAWYWDEKRGGWVNDHSLHAECPSVQRFIHEENISIEIIAKEDWK